MQKIIIDFETRSTVDLKKIGMYRYSKHPTTEAICMGLKVDDHPTAIWVNPKFLKMMSIPYQLPLLPQDPKNINWSQYIMEAHNSGFERCIWENIMVPQYNWPKVPLEQWRCIAARCSASALPRGLDKACKALNLDTLKDEKGHRLMLTMCKPRNARKPEKIRWLKEYETRHGIPNKRAKDYSTSYLDWAESQMGMLWHEEPEKLVQECEYCIQDVESEYAVSQAVRELDRKEQEIWFIDQRINDRGVPIDIETVNAVIDIIGDYEQKLLDEISELTDGQITSPRQRDASLEWLKGQGIHLPDMKAETIESFLKESDIIPF
jgi:DNA polymerase